MPLQAQKGKDIREKSRMNVRFLADRQTYSSTSLQTIRIRVPGQGKALDFSNHLLSFKISATISGATLSSFNNWSASTWIRAIRFYSGSKQVGETLQNYNGFCAFMLPFQAKQGSYSTVAKLLEGSNAGSEIYTTAITQRRYGHSFIAGLPTCHDYYVNNMIDDFNIEIDMETADRVIKHDGTNAVYTIEDIAFVCDTIELTDSYKESVSTVASGPGVKYHYVEYSMTEKSDVSGSGNVRAGILDGGLKSAFAFSVLDSVRASNANDYWASKTRNNLSSYEFRIGGYNLKQSATLVGANDYAEQLFDLQNALKLTQSLMPFEMGVSALNIGQTVDTEPTDFVVAQRADLSNSEREVSSRIDASRNELELRLQYGSAPAAQTLYVFGLLDKEAVVKTIGSGRYMVDNTPTDQLLKEQQQQLENL